MRAKYFENFNRKRALTSSEFEGYRNGKPANIDFGSPVNHPGYMFPVLDVAFRRFECCIPTDTHGKIQSLGRLRGKVIFLRCFSTSQVVAFWHRPNILQCPSSPQIRLDCRGLL